MRKDRQDAIDARLSALGSICDTGYSVALHIRHIKPTHVFQTYPKPWTERYLAESLALKDPVVQWALFHTGHVYWSELADPAGIIAAAAEAGLRNGLSCAVGPDNSRSISGFSRSSGPFTEAEAEHLQRLTQELHDLTAS